MFVESFIVESVLGTKRMRKFEKENWRTLRDFAAGTEIVFAKNNSSFVEILKMFVDFPGTFYVFINIYNVLEYYRISRSNRKVVKKFKKVSYMCWLFRNICEYFWNIRESSRTFQSLHEHFRPRKLFVKTSKTFVEFSGISESFQEYFRPSETFVEISGNFEKSPEIFVEIPGTFWAFRSNSWVFRNIWESSGSFVEISENCENSPKFFVSSGTFLKFFPMKVSNLTRFSQAQSTWIYFIIYEHCTSPIVIIVQTIPC